MLPRCYCSKRQHSYFWIWKHTFYQYYKPQSPKWIKGRARERGERGREGSGEKTKEIKKREREMCSRGRLVEGEWERNWGY